MGAYSTVPLGEWSPTDVARNIVNQVLDQFPEVTVDRRQAMNDPCDAFVSGLLQRWVQARGATLAAVVRQFLEVSDLQADEGREIADSDPAPEDLGDYFTRWGPRIEANWAMLRKALATFEGQAP